MPVQEQLPTLPRDAIATIVERALAEDLPWGDITTDTLIPAGARSMGRLVAKAGGIICGLPVAAAVFSAVDPDLRFDPCLRDGDRTETGAVIAEIRGATSGILKAERTVLNLLQRMSGIATATSRYVEAIVGTGASIVDTRKTAPGLRVLDKYAVRCGGGSNHRFCLSDGVLIKDNHLAALGDVSMPDALRTMRGRVPHTVKIEVEVDRIDQIDGALTGGADIILLDNMPPATLCEVVELIAGRALTEASGGITLESVRAVAEAGVDLISVGALTHSVRALDISLDLEPA